MGSRLAPSLQAFLDLPPEDRRLGPFRLVEQLGKGGFAPVWLAEEVYGETKLRTAAVKLFAYGEPDEDGRTSATGRMSTAGLRMRDRITEEARSLCRVEHPNVVRFYSLPTDDQRGIIGLAMEYVAGTSLDRRLAGSRGDVRGIPLAEVLSVGIAVASALAVVHQIGLVHRDIKPANVIESAGVYKLIDFGIASAERTRAREAEPAAPPPVIVLGDVPIHAIGSRADMLLRLPGAQGSLPSLTSAIMSGTVGYIDPKCMPPECARATSSSDLYALGAMLFECVTGRIPAVAAAGDGGGMKTEVLDGREKSPPLRALSPDVPASLARLIDALLDPEPAGRPRSAEAVARDLERIRGELAGASRALPSEEIGPFRGLSRFEEGDRDVYFGRSAEVAATLERLRGRGLVAIVGASGSGKSSLARAGVVPAIVEGALGWPKQWDRAICTPGADPLASMLEALTPFLPEGTRGSESIVAALAERAQTMGRGLVLVVDQLEELATIVPVSPAALAKRAHAVELLARFGEQPLVGVRVLCAARRDLLDPLLALDEVLGRVLTRGMMLVAPLADTAWHDVLEQALEAYGYGFEDDALRGEILTDLRGTASAMPLVQFALTQLWAQRDVAGKRITRAGHRAIGGISGALDRHARATLERLVRADPSARELAREILVALTTAQGTRVTRGLDELQSIGGAKATIVVRALEEARLLSRDGDGVSLAHEALLAQWEELRGWIHEAREDRLLAEELERDAAKWSEAPDASLLWRKRRLAAAEEVRRRGTVRLSDIADRYLSVGRGEERRGIFLAVAAALVVVFAGAVGAGLYVRDIHAARVAAEQKAIEASRSEVVAQTSMKQAKAETERADLASEKARLAAKDADDAKKDFENRLNDLKSELKKNINDAAALKQLAKQVNDLTSKPPKPPPPGTLDAGSVSQTGLPP